MHGACTKRLYYHFRSKIWRHHRVIRPSFLLWRGNFGDSAINNGYIAYFSLRMRETAVFPLPVWNLTSRRVPRPRFPVRRENYWPRFGQNKPRDRGDVFARKYRLCSNAFRTVVINVLYYFCLFFSLFAIIVWWWIKLYILNNHLKVPTVFMKHGRGGWLNRRTPLPPLNTLGHGLPV